MTLSRHFWLIAIRLFELLKTGNKSTRLIYRNSFPFSFAYNMINPNGFPCWNDSSARHATLDWRTDLLVAVNELSIQINHSLYFFYWSHSSWHFQCIFHTCISYVKTRNIDRHNVRNPDEEFYLQVASLCMQWPAFPRSSISSAITRIVALRVSV